MIRIWLIAHKDMKEAFGQRTLLLRVVLPVLLLPILYGVLTAVTIGRNLQPDQAAIVAGMISVWTAIVAVVGTSFGGVMAAQAIALERERGTIEALLATPAADREIFAGKALAAFLPGLAGGYGAGLLYFLSFHLLSTVEPGIPPPAAAFFARFVALLLPIIVALQVGGGVMISGRCGTVTGATQLSALMSIPVIGATLYLAYQARLWPSWHLVLLVAALLALDAIILHLGARTMGREEIIARLD
jgi:ABC-2 type transport system permease protein